MMSNHGDVYMLTLLRHIDLLREQGATDEEIVIEVAGHVFHEAVHQGEEGLDDALLAGGSALGEVTSIASQLATTVQRNS